MVGSISFVLAFSEKKLEDRSSLQAFKRNNFLFEQPLFLLTNFVRNAPHRLRMDPATPNQERRRSSRSMVTITLDYKATEQARYQKAARELLLGKYKNAREAADANDCAESARLYTRQTNGKRMGL